MNTLGMFARFPSPGSTKTRLAAAIGDQPAADLYSCFVRDLVKRSGQLADRQQIAVTPATDESLQWFAWLQETCGNADCRILTQPDGDLGTRIAWFFREAARQDAGPTVLIGTDSPDLPSSRITQAFELLNNEQADVVIGPAADGGYVLIGLVGDPQSLFEQIRWSSPRTLLDTIAAVERAGRNLTVLPMWYDVDHVENLGTLAALQSQPGLTEAAACPLTVEYLNRFMLESGNG